MKCFDDVYEEIKIENAKELKQLMNSFKNTALRQKNANRIVIIIILSLVYSLFNVWDKIFISDVLLFIGYLCIIFIFIEICAIVISIKSLRKEHSMNTENILEDIKEKLIKKIDCNLNYLTSSLISSELYSKADFESYNLFSATNGIEGKVENKYYIAMAEVKTQNEYRSSDGHISTEVVFHGIFGYIKLSKNIKTSLKIRLDAGNIGNIFKENTQIEMDSQEFEKYFDIYSENKIIAMQILTADVMEFLIEFTKKYQINYELTIKEDNLFIRFYTEEIFKPTAEFYDSLKEFYEIIELIIKLSIGINKKIESTEI